MTSAREAEGDVDEPDRNVSLVAQLKKRAASYKDRDPIDVKRRTSRRKSRRRSSSSSDESVFRKAPALFKQSQLLKVADQKSGALLENGLGLMRRALATRMGGGEITAEEQKQLDAFQGIVTQYLTVGLMPGVAATGNPLSMRNEREMRTIAEALDALTNGNLGLAGDILMQRFRACEINAQDGTWDLAKHMELIPDRQVSSVPLGMRQVLMREENQRMKYATQNRRGGAG